MVLLINSIELTNWKTHGSTKLSFSRGTNILIGHMGAGKSSIMDAISFGLFGTFPAIKNRRVNVNDLIRNRPDQKKSAKIRLSFDVGEDSYIVEREISLEGAGKATLQKNGTYVQSQPQRVTEEVEKALAMDYDLFSRAVYSEQNRLDYFLELQSRERKKQMDNLLGLDKFATAQENTTSLINKIKEMTEEGKKAAESFDIEMHKSQMAALEEERRAGLKDIDGIALSIGRLREDHKKIQGNLKKMKEDYNRKIAVEKEIAELKSKTEILSKEISKIDSEKLGNLGGVKKELESCESEANKAKAKGKELMLEAQSAQTRLGKIQNEISSVEKDLLERKKLDESLKGKDKEKLAQDLEMHKREIEKIEGEVASATAQKNDAEKWIKELERHVGKCPVCERDLDQRMREELLRAKKESAASSSNKAKSLQEIQKAKKADAERLSALINELHLVQERLKRYQNLDERRTKAEEELKKAEGESARLKEEVERINDATEALNRKLSELKTARNALERKELHLSEKAKAEEGISKKQEEFKGIKIDEKSLDELQRQFTEISSGISKNEATLEGLSKALDEKAARIEEKRRDIEKIERLYNDIKYKKVVADNLVKFNNSLQETQAHLRNRLVGSINGIMEEIWPELYPYGDYSGVELSATESDYILRICTYREGKESWEDVDTIASGGERSVACLALRVAFAMVLVPNLKWLILDEPTHNIDRQGIGRFVNVFNEKLPQIVGQIFIITHDEQLKQVSNGKVYMLGRDKTKNEETSAIPM